MLNQLQLEKPQKQVYTSLENYRNYLENQITELYKHIAALKNGAYCENQNLISTIEYAITVTRTCIGIVNQRLSAYH